MPSPIAILKRTPQERRLDSIEALRADSVRLDRLIEWLSFNDTLDEALIRDWTDAEDARKAIDEAVLL